MPEPFHFGRRERALFGIRHRAPAPRSAMLVCAPLLQEGIRCQRSLWSLSEALAASGTDVMRFDWFGTGDSAGDGTHIDVPGLVDDVDAALSMLRIETNLARPRLLGLRSAALPLLAYASASRQPLDVVLWAPALDGRALVADWRAQHRQQLNATGRYRASDVSSDQDELLGFVVGDRLLEGLEGLQGNDLPLAPGSKLLLVKWQAASRVDAFVRAQREAGVTVECFDLASPDEPDWEDPGRFETQVFPRRAVGELARHLAEAA